MTTTVKKIDAKLKTFTTNVAKLKVLGHEIAMMVLDHCLAHGDCTRAILLVERAPNSWTPQIEKWFKDFTPIRVISKNGKCELDPKYKAAKSPEDKAAFWDRDTALVTTFDDVMEEPKVDKFYDFDALVKLVERLPAMIGKKIEEGKVKPEDLLSAEAIKNQLSALKFSRVFADNDDGKASHKGTKSLMDQIDEIAPVAKDTAKAA